MASPTMARTDCSPTGPNSTMKDETAHISFEAKVGLVMLWVYGLLKKKKER